MWVVKGVVQMSCVSPVAHDCFWNGLWDTCVWLKSNRLIGSFTGDHLKNIIVMISSMAYEFKLDGTTALLLGKFMNADISQT